MSRICHSADGEPATNSKSATVVDLDRARLERLAEQIARMLVDHHGAVMVSSAGLDVELWRRAARRAGRLLGVPVRTGVAADGSSVWVVDES